MRRRGGAVPVFSIREPAEEPRQDFPPELSGVTAYLPQSFDAVLAGSSSFRRQARRALVDLRRLWGDESEKKRIYEALWLGPVLKRAGVRHVHAHFAGIGARTAWWLRRLSGITYSFTAHANDIFCDEPHARLEMLVRDAAFVVSVSDYSVEYLGDLFPMHRSKIHRVYNGIDLERFALSQPRTDRPRILAVGRYIEKKGFADLVSACGSLGDRNFECLIVGQGPLEDALKKQVADLGIADRVSIAGPRSEREVAELLQGASVFALPCVTPDDGGKDNLPTVIMEAAAAGVPVVSTPVAGVPEMVIDGRTGFLVPERSPLAVAEKLGVLLDDAEAARAMGHAGRTLCEERFSVERTSGALAALFGMCLSKKTNGSWLERIFRAG